MTSTDWPQIDSASMNPASMAVSSSDLFGGELFGDELMDMYNSAAVVDAAAGGSAAAENEIPTLLLSTSNETTNKNGNAAEESAAASEHPGTEVALTAAAIDDGLGAFRPATSFSDFTTLLSPAGDTDGDEKDSKEDESATKKRNCTATPAQEPPPSKKTKSAVSAPATASAPVAAVGPSPTVENATSASQVPASAGQAAQAALKARKDGQTKGSKGKKKNTPNPLTLPSQTTLPKISSAPSVAPAAVVTPKANNTTAVVSSAPIPAASSTQPGQPVLAPAPAPIAAPAAVVAQPAPAPLAAPTPVATMAAPPVQAAAAPTVTPPATSSVVPVAPVSNVAAVPAPSAAAPAPSAVAPAPAARPAATAPASAAVNKTVMRADTVASSATATAAAAASAMPATAVVPSAAVKAAVAAATAATVAPAVPTAPSGHVAPGGHNTEADFKGVAQAAVTSLILNANGPVPTTAPESTPASRSTISPTITPGKVDTSTAHITALTSNNWVAACSGMPGAIGQTAAAAADAAAKAARGARRANLSPDERAKQNRDRNREHARNTRLRKKAYVEELKRTLTELVSQRDASELERRHGSQRDLEQREVRFRVMEEFLKLRGRNEVNVARWVAILEDNFVFTLPKVEYRKTVAPKSTLSRQVSVDAGIDSAAATANAVATATPTPNPLEQTLTGANEAMEDASHLSALLNTLGHGKSAWAHATAQAKSGVCLAYNCDRKKFLMDGTTAVMEWTATTVGAVGQGAPSELTLKGSMRSTFSPASNKLITVDLLFDTGSVSQQLKRLVIQPTPPVPAATPQQPVPILSTDNCDAVAAAAAAAQAAAHEADALLDSLQMPQLAAVSMVPPVVVTAPVPLTDPCNITVAAPTAAVSVTSLDKAESSSDESLGETPTATNAVETAT